jgi:tricarballylate dehydrogenase
MKIKETTKLVDVLIIGDGLAGRLAALAAQREGASVLIIEKCSAREPHGNTAFSGGAFRRVSRQYPEKKYFSDIMKVSEGDADPRLTRITIRNSQKVIARLRGLGVRWTLPSSNPGRALSVLGRGAALVTALSKAVKKANVPIMYNTKALEILRSKGRPAGVKVRQKKGVTIIPSKAIILATGGFQANRKMVVRYLGKGAHRLVLRGYKGNTGDGLVLAKKLGARLEGMEGYHGGIIHYGYKMNPRFGARKGMRSVKRYEPGILANQEGQRFVDEGEDTADKTYAKFGRIIALTQPGGIAYLIFDSRAKETIDPMYRGPGKGPIESPTIRDLATKLGIDPPKLQRTIENFNAAVSKGKTTGIMPPKSHFAERIEKPPFCAYIVTGGMTFTFGGIKISERSEVLDKRLKAVPGFYAAGEITGGFFYHNYPAGSSLTRCAVFGEIAGQNAARYARNCNRL